MTVDFRLAPQPVNYLEPLQAMALGQQAARQRAAEARADQTRATVSAKLGTKDYVGAETAALSGGDAELAGHIATLDNAARARVADGFNTIGSLAFDLKKITDPAERAARFQAAIPLLRAHGLGDDLLQHADLSDHGLDSYITSALTVKEKIAQANEEASRNKPMVVGADSGVFDPASRSMIVAPQHKLSIQTVTNADGTQSIVPVDPYTGAAGGVAARGDGGGGGVPSGGVMSPKAAEVASTLASAGLPAPVVAGFMGNFHVEGGYDGAQGDGGSASGIAQWHSDRASTFQRVIGKPVTEATPAEQAQFVAWEMQNPQAAGMTVAQRDAILAAKTAPEAAALIDQHYERSSGRDRQTRMSAAAAFAGGSTQAAPASGGAVYTSRGGTGNDAGMDDKGLDYVADIYRRTGQLPPLGMGKAAATLRTKIIQRAQQRDAAEGISGTDAVAVHYDTKAGGASLAQQEKNADAIIAAEQTALANGQQFLDRSREMHAQTHYPWLNSVVNAAQRATGGETVKSMDIAHDTFMTEYAKVVAGSPSGAGVLSDSARQHALGLISGSATYDQKVAAFNQLKADMHNRVQALQEQQRTIRTRLRGGGSVRHISGDADYNALPSGTHFIGPDGHERVKP